MSLIRGFLFASTTKTEEECFERSLFGTERGYGPVVVRIRKGDLLFLNNIDLDTLQGVFRARSDGMFNIQPDAWNGKYPYQVQVERLGTVTTLDNANSILKKFGLKRNMPLYGKRLTDFLNYFIPQPTLLETKKEAKRLLTLQEKIQKDTSEIDIEDEIPLLESTTLWDFPKQSYGLTPKGNNKYAGVTPALIIYNLIWRYTDQGDLVVDPMCGSGTTIDVCKAEKRKAIGYDIVPTRPDIIQNDARKIPLKDNSVDMVFIDSPYGDNIKYNDHPDCIGNISSESEEFYIELERTMQESHRILKEGKVLAWLIGDQWVRDKFTPVGLEIYGRLCDYFEPVDIICVSRRGQSSNTGVWHNRALRFNFYLRGFKYLIIVRKNTSKSERNQTRKIKWARYKRGNEADNEC